MPQPTIARPTFTTIRRSATGAVLALALSAGTAMPALADGAASTRNILIGGAAAAAGTLLIINHNKQVHQKYADDARRQAQSQAAANNAQAAYAAEHRAYQNEVAVNNGYKHEVATQRSLIASLRKQVALEKNRADRALRPAPVSVGQTTSKTAPAGSGQRVATAAWGWGQL